VADSMWRLRRLKKSVQTELCLNPCDPQHPVFDEVWGFVMFLSRLETEPETCFAKYAKKYLRADKIEYLERKFPRSNYQSAAEWAKAITAEILPLTLNIEPPESEGEIDPLKKATREWKTEQQVYVSFVYARELLEIEAKETEKLEARIARQTRHCAELKAMEELLSKK
jgi:hypothetical protein